MKSLRFCSISLITALLMSSVSFSAPQASVDYKNGIVMFINSSKVLARSKMTSVDTKNTKVMPLVKDGRTLVPIRFISEMFGASVDFIAAKREVAIAYNSKVVKITLDEKKYYIDKKEYEFEVPAQIYENRTLVPLRALCEDVLNKEVYFVNGVISIYDKDYVEQPDNNEISKNYQLSEPTNDDVKLKIATSKGDIYIKLFAKDAPKTVVNFLALAKDKFYSNIIFHRVYESFMIQGGDPTGTGMGGKSIFGEKFEDEISPRLSFLRGSLAMANSGPNTNGSQFFIVQKPQIDSNEKLLMKNMGLEDEKINDYMQYGGTPWLEGRHTIFGQVYSGMNIVDEIAKAPANEQGRPNEDIKILSVDIL